MIISPLKYPFPNFIVPELLKFLPEPRSIAITCLEQQIELSCYVRHYKTLLWFHYDNASQIWEEVKLSSHVYPSPEGDNRTLVLERPALSDGGWYRCTAEDGRGHKISHNISLIIQGRDLLCIVKTTLLGGVVSYECHGVSNYWQTG